MPHRHRGTGGGEVLRMGRYHDRRKRWEGWGCLLLAVMVLLTVWTIALALGSVGPHRPPH